VNAAPLINLVQTSLKFAAPLIYSALGETVVERSGVINVGIEGMMLAGACAAYGVASIVPSWIGGVAAGALAGVVLAAVFAFAALKFDADQVVIGTAINILALGLTGVYIWNRQNGVSGNSVATIASVPHIHLSIHGHLLLETSVLGLFAYLMVPICSFFFRRTSVALRLIATGEYPAAAEDAGVTVAKMRLGAVLFGGLMAGLAGAYLSIDNTVTFGEGLTGGIGFVALAVVIVGRWSPLGVLLASLLFSTASAMQFDFQSLHTHIPQQALLALPYVLTLAALVGRAGKTAAPAALGEPYRT